MFKYRTLFFIYCMMIPVIFSGCKSSREKNMAGENNRPNIIIIYMDDLGYGDVSSYGATEIHTPNIDRLANEGLRFTRGYATSATCSPSRYALLTGEYPWRNENARILSGTAPLLIDTSQLTIPKLLKEKGYNTGVVGKWHLGLGDGNVNWNEHVSPGPNEVGFDYSYIMAATQDRVPTVYLENGYVVGLNPDDPIYINYEKNFPGEPTGKDNPELLKMRWHHGHNNSIVNGIPRIGFMKGGKSARWVDEEMSNVFLGKVREYIVRHKNEPFFLYYALQQPHVPRTPNQKFVGSTGMGPRGDVIIEADWCVGELLKTLEEEELLENTFIVFSSDNGPVLNDGYYDDAVEKLGDHDPTGGFRGGKYSLFEAGTRVPFITYWKDRIAPGISDAMVCQLDLLSSIADLVGSKATTPDSKDLLSTFFGNSDQGRDQLVLEATSRTAFRKENWVMIPPYDGPAKNTLVNIELGNSDSYQLYNLQSDPAQKNNLAEKKPEKLKEMISEFQEIRGKDYGRIEALELK